MSYVSLILELPEITVNTYDGRDLPSSILTYCHAIRLVSVLSIVWSHGHTMA